MILHHCGAPFHFGDIEVIGSAVHGVNGGKLDMHIAADLMQKCFAFRIADHLFEKSGGDDKTFCAVVQKFPDSIAEQKPIQLVPVVIKMQFVIHDRSFCRYGKYISSS